ncbi:ARID DNA-binding domain [Trinorchestia longiramus]|nr:ARID DNA-binding domain [Trinorchestia longiramus]
MQDMEEDMNGSNGGGRDSPLRPPPQPQTGEDILAKLRQQVSMASHRDGNVSPPSSSPHIAPLHTPAEIYTRIHSLLQGRYPHPRREEDDTGGSMEEAFRADALHKHREAMLSSPQALLASAFKAGMPPSLVPPSSHIPLIPGGMGIPSTTQLPPTPGSAGSRDSSGNGSRTPSHTPEPANQNWNFDDQYKQNQEPSKHSSFEEDKRKLYELSDDIKRREFLDDLFSFMQQRGTPINRLPIMAKQVLDLYELYNLVVSRGGLVDVINKKLWQEIIKGLKLPSSITSAAFTLRTQYMKYIYPYECEKNKLSSPQELQVAIDGNRREGRRSSYAAGFGELNHPILADFQNFAGGYGDLNQPALMNFQTLHNFPGMPRLHTPLGLVSRPQLNGSGVPGHHMVPPDLLRGSGGSPPGGTQQSVAEAARINFWKLYNQGLSGGTGMPGVMMGNSMGAAGMMPSHEDERNHLTPHHPLLPPHPPQREALNLDVKDEYDVGPPRSAKKESPGSGEESNGLPPAPKRLHEDEASVRDLPVTPSSASSLPPSSIEINSIPSSESNRNGSHNGTHTGQSLSINMEINGIQYKGVLWPQHPSTSPPRASHHHSSNALLPQLSGSPLIPSPASPVGLGASRFR